MSRWVGAWGHLSVTVLKRQHSLSNVDASCVFIQGAKHTQQAEAVPAIQVLHHNVQVVPAGEAVVEAHLQPGVHQPRRCSSR